jgi:methylated-DNA-[protein]-cysteine S-methyltransferase
MSSPLGLLFLARTEHGLRFVDFLERRSLKRAFASHAEAVPDAKWEPSLLELKPVVDQLDCYFCGNLTRFTLPLDLVGTEFQLKVWRALCGIPYGETRAYGQIAKALGQPGAARAVGLANNHNPVPIIVPCHRVIGADGELTGYGGGLPRKRKLLDLEARFAHSVGPAGSRFTAS